MLGIYHQSYCHWFLNRDKPFPRDVPGALFTNLQQITDKQNT